MAGFFLKIMFISTFFPGENDCDAQCGEKEGEYLNIQLPAHSEALKGDQPVRKLYPA